jgi:hypothetical protein
MTVEIVLKVKSGDDSVRILRMLLGSGTSTTMLLDKHIECGRLSGCKGRPLKWINLPDPNDLLSPTFVNMTNKLAAKYASPARETSDPLVRFTYPVLNTAADL